MNCRYHKEEEAKFICDKCKMPICEDCSSDVRGNKVCKVCIEKSVYAERDRVQRIGFWAKLGFFIFACIPGAAHMQMGLFKRGMQLMLTFIGAIVLFSFISIEILIPLFIIPTWFFSFFDAYNARRKMQKGEDVEDVELYNYQGTLDSVLQNRKILGFVLIAFGAFGLMNTLENVFFHNQVILFNLDLSVVYWAVRRGIFPIALVLIGVYMLSKVKKSKNEMNQENPVYEDQ